MQEINEMWLNPCPNGTFFRWTKFKAFADDAFGVAKLIISVFYRVENIVGKGENAGYQHFFPFPQYFQKASFSESLKVMSRFT